MAVFADSISAPYTKYPGGVIALRAYDWLGPARGTLTTEADSRSPVGTVVRDSQKVTTSIKNDFQGAFAEADDTFVLDFADLPLETDMFYIPVFSFLIEGDWGTVLELGEQDNFGSIVDLRGYGDTYRPLESQSAIGLIIKTRKFDQFMIQQSNVGFLAYSGTNVYHFRAYAQTGTTIEFLFDQIWLFPDGAFGSNPEWGDFDFRLIPGSIPDYPVWFPWIDGADGGDSNGKFTINPYINDSIWDASDWSPWVGDAGGHDYQKKSSAAGAEYWARIIPDDGFPLRDSTKPAGTPESEPKASHLYGVHGAFYYPDQIVTSDHFSRTLFDGDFDGADGHFAGSHWGNTPEGFGWDNAPGYLPAGPADTTFGFRKGRALWVDGSRANMRIVREFQGDLESLYCTLQHQGNNNPFKPGIILDSADISGKVYLDYSVAQFGSTPYVQLTISTRYSLGFTPTMEIAIDSLAQTFTIQSTGATVAGPVDISSWWNGLSEIGWRMRQDRYRIRFKIWDASGAEPSSWDYDGFMRVGTNTYPYGDNPAIAYRKLPVGLLIGCFTGGITYASQGLFVSWDDIVINHDIGSGTISPTHFSVEHPDGTPIDSITIPVGAQRVVFWGTKDWTDYVPDDDSYVAFSQKQWSETTAPALQGAATPWWYIRSKHKGANPQIIRYRT